MDLPRYRRLNSAYYRLEGSRCQACGALCFPARELCGACRGRDLVPYRFSGRGTIFSYAEVAQPPRGFAGPYLVALVDLEEGVRLTAQLTDVDLDEVRIGMPVEMVTRRLQERGTPGHGYLVYGYKFRPAAAPRSSTNAPSAASPTGGAPSRHAG
ncbi:MAG TPA: Zn-ribbon domain-containing OB-fold protein [Thermoanaerobaculia bacterium]|nr:Zn-ribbon domain-containing OB-fold protein [Thermoanaerobaculia bacterium]